jgi:hypothetical protein
MATVTASKQPHTGIAPRERVQHPLRRLRGIIRMYVCLEALGIAVLFATLWFWISLIIDYGFFQLTGVDWVQVVPRGFRAVLLVVLAAGLVAVVIRKMLLRLFREFSDSAVALVLERRYPAELGDRLMTAVELADTRIADRYSFSQPMIDYTIADAAERVDRLAVAGVFNWRRLRLLAIRVAILTVGVYAMGGIGYCLTRHRPLGDFVLRFNNVAMIWFERNILLVDTIWPRRAYLELVNFPPSGELRVGRDSPPPGLRVRAVEWVIADLRAPEGWRPLRWEDLDRRILGGRWQELYRILEEPDFKDTRAKWRYWTIDQINVQLAKPEAATEFQGRASEIGEVLTELERRVASPRLERIVRRLTIPDKVVVYYRGETTRSEQTLKKQADNEYAGFLTDLKESIRFTANGEDYYTPYKTITLVPPPGLTELTRADEQPAYIYHRPPAGAPPRFLKDKKQEFKDTPVSLSGSASRIEVPGGTNVVLKGKTDKALLHRGLSSSEGVKIRLREGSAPASPLIRLTSDTSFEARFDNVTSTLDFAFELTDTDGVTGFRSVVIRPADDAPPDVDVQVEYIRKTSQGYIVTPSAGIPFVGKVRDDHGLDKVDYAYELMPLDVPANTIVGPAVTALGWLPTGTGADFLSIAYLDTLGAVSRFVTEEPAKPNQRVAVSSFARRMETSQEEIAMADWLKRLHEKPANGLVKDFTFDPDEKADYFNVEALGLKVTDERQSQPRYRMRLWVLAEDNNVETGPGVSPSKEKFPFIIVSENELLLEIAREEEGLHVKLEDTVNKLKDTRSKLEVVILELPSLKGDEFSPMARRLEEIGEVLTKSWDVTSEISKDYQRILKELKVNRVNPKFIDKIERNIADPLQEVISPDREFDRTDKSLRSFQKLLEEKKSDASAAAQAKQDIDKLIVRLTQVLDNMGDIITINRLIEQLAELERRERKAYQRFKELSEQYQEELLLGPEEKKK